MIIPFPHQMDIGKIVQTLIDGASRKYDLKEVRENLKFYEEAANNHILAVRGAVAQEAITQKGLVAAGVCKYARSHGDQIILALHGESWLGGGDSPLAQIANQLEEYPSFENLRKMETEVKGKLYDRRNGIETEVADFLQYFGENGAITLKGLTAQELKRQRSLEGWINCLESFGNPELFESVKESSYARKEGIVPVLRARELSSYVDATRDRMYIIEFDFLMHNRDIDANAASFATRMDAQRKQINALFQQDYQGPIRDSGSGEVMVKSSDVLGYVKERAVKALTFPEIGPVGFYARHSSEVFATLSVRPDAEHPLRRIELAPIRS